MPDVSGIDRAFDYLVPDSLVGHLTIGQIVRINLNGRRVKGWVIGRSDQASVLPELLSGPYHSGELQEIVDLRGSGVPAELVPTAAWAAERWIGPLRSVMVAASAPRLRDKVGSPQHRLVPTGDSDHRRVPLSGVALHYCSPQQPVISLALEATARGPVLLLCPTVDMARRGAAWLRGRGAVVAEHPDDWSRAAGGVDIVVGARSAAWAPVPQLSTVIVVDEHDLAYVESRSPNWDATSVVRRRAEIAGAEVILSSPVPTLSSVDEAAGRTIAVHPSSDSAPWGDIRVVDLTAGSENGGVTSTLLSASMLARCRDGSLRAGVILNTLDDSVGSKCARCGQRTKCPQCGGVLVLEGGGGLRCGSCETIEPALCNACGSTTLRAARIGVRGLAGSLRKAVGREVAEVSSSGDDPSPTASVFVGTEALVHRVQPLDAVILADVDAWLASARLGSIERLWAVVVRSMRVLGGSGTLLLQTRSPEHPVLAALVSAGRAGTDAYLEWAHGEIATRRSLGMPPMAASALVQESGVPLRLPEDLDGSIRVARTPGGVLLASSDRSLLVGCIGSLRESNPRLRVTMDPREV